MTTNLPPWRKVFKTKSELEQGPIQFFIKDFLPEGVTFLGGLSGHGKSWLALSMAKALTTGQKFLGMFDVPEPQNVLYLAPEAGERSLRTRLDLMDVPEDRFWCTTVNNGIMRLNNIDLMLSVNDLKPIIFLDTAIRFLHGADENSSSETSTSLADAVFRLRVGGAKGIVGLHHSPKASAGSDFMTLENTLRGTGDIGAMCDAVYGVRSIDKDQLILRVVSVKSRDFEPPAPFHIQGRPYITETGDFAVLTGPPVSNKSQKLIAAIERNPKASYRELSAESGISKGHIADIANRAGWSRDKTAWKHTNGRSGNVPDSFREPSPPVVFPPTPLRGGNGEQGTERSDRPKNIWDLIDP